MPVEGANRGKTEPGPGHTLALLPEWLVAEGPQECVVCRAREVWASHASRVGEGVADREDHRGQPGRGERAVEPAAAVCARSPLRAVRWSAGAGWCPRLRPQRSAEAGGGGGGSTPDGYPREARSLARMEKPAEDSPNSGGAAAGEREPEVTEVRAAVEAAGYELGPLSGGPP
ncbi:hypothetical protein GCM10009642_06870 [Nocardiopsis metallicus]